MSSIRTEVEKLIKLAGDNALTAQAVVEAAKDEKTYPALHAHLWLVQEAKLAAEARLARAHHLLIRIQITTREGITTRLLVHTRDVEGYQPVALVAATPNLAKSKLAQLRADIGRARERLLSFSAILDPELIADVDNALRNAEKRLEPSEGDQAAA